MFCMFAMNISYTKIYLLAFEGAFCHPTIIEKSRNYVLRIDIYYRAQTMSNSFYLLYDLTNWFLCTSIPCCSNNRNRSFPKLFDFYKRCLLLLLLLFFSLGLVQRTLKLLHNHQTMSIYRIVPIDSK